MQTNLTDMFGNDFKLYRSEKVQLKSIRNGIPTLQELTGRVIKKSFISYYGRVPNHLVRYLISLHCCRPPYCSGFFECFC